MVIRIAQILKTKNNKETMTIIVQILKICRLLNLKKFSLGSSTPYFVKLLMVPKLSYPHLPDVK